MFKDKKTQFAIRKLTTGTGILLLSVGMGMSLSSRKVNASEIDPTQSEVVTESATEQVAVPVQAQEADDASAVETTSNVEEKTVTEVPTETVIPEKKETNEPVSKTEEPVQGTTITDNTNVESNDNVNTETQAPENNTPATQPETEEVDKGKAENDQVEDEGSSLPENNEGETDSDKSESEDNVDEADKNEDEATESDKDKPEKAESEEAESKPNGKDSILDKFFPMWDEIANKDQFPGWESIFNGHIAFDRVDDFHISHPKWQSTITGKEITITQTVTGKDPHEIKITYDVEIIVGTRWNWDKLHHELVIDSINLKNISPSLDNTNHLEFEKVDTTKPGFESTITGTVTGDVSGKLTNADLTSNIHGNNIQTSLTKDNLMKLLQRGENLTFQYDVTYTPKWDLVEWPPDIDKDDIKDLKPDEHGNWSGTLNKVINQTVNGQGDYKLNLSQKVDVAFKWDRNKNKLVATVKGSGNITMVGNTAIDITKPGFTYDKNVSATIGKDNDNRTEFDGFKVNEHDNIIINDNAWTDITTINKNTTINYQVNYTPDVKDSDLPEGVNPGDVTWTDNGDGTWTGTTTIKKDIYQSVNGSTPTKVTLSQNATLTLTQNADKSWSLTETKFNGSIGMEGNDAIDITRPGFTYDKNASATIGKNDTDRTEFKGFEIVDGQLSIKTDAWNGSDIIKIANGSTINYTVNYNPDLSGVTLPEGINKDEINTWTDNKDGSWTSNTVNVNKTINTTVNNNNDDKHQLALSQTATVKLTWDKENKKWNVELTNLGDVKVPTNSLNINKDGFSHDDKNITASIENVQFDIKGDAISITSLPWTNLSVLDKNTVINFNVGYKPDLSGVTLPDGVDKNEINTWTDNKDGSWTSNTVNVNKTINTTVNNNNDDKHQLALSQTATVKLTWDKENKKWNVELTNLGDVKVPTNSLNINKDGFSHDDKNITASIENVQFDVKGDAISITSLPWTNLSVLDKNTVINFNVGYKPDLSGVTLPDGVDKNEINTWTENKDGSWTSNTITINKDIFHSVNGGNTTNITLSQSGTVTAKWDNEKNDWIVTAEGTGEITIKDNISIDIGKPGHSYETTSDGKVPATIKENADTNGKTFDGFKVADDKIVFTTDLATIKGDSIIDFTVNYTAIPPKSDTITLPDKKDDIWKDTNVTDQEKDDIIDKIEDGGLAWTDNGDGTWSAIVDFNKQISQSVSGNIINSDITLDVTKKVTLTAKLDADGKKYNITKIVSGKWTTTSQDKLDHEFSGDNNYDISASVNGTENAELATAVGNKVENKHTIPGLGSDIIQKIINDQEYSQTGTTKIQLSYQINAKPSSTDPDNPNPGNPDPDNPDTPSTPDDPNNPSNPGNPDNPGDNTGSGDSNNPGNDNGSGDSNNPGNNNGSNDSNNSGNTPGSSDSNESTQPKPEVSPDDGTPEDFTRPLPEDVEEDEDNKSNKNSSSSKSESSKNNATAGNSATGSATNSNIAGKTATIVPLSESTNASANNSTDSQNGSAATANEASLPQTGEKNDKMTTMGIIMAGLASALTTLGMAIKKRKDQ